MSKEISKNIWKSIYIPLSVQAVSLFSTGIGVLATLFTSHTKIDVSTTLSAGVYFTLSATAVPYAAYQPGFVDRLKRCWWQLVIIGIADYYSTYLHILAISYTSVSSNQVIMTSFYTLLIVILGLIIATTRHKIIHYTFIIMTISSGIIVIIWQDMEDTDKAGSYPFHGDMLSLASGILAIFATICETFLIKERIDTLEFMSVLGFSGAIISSIQLCILDYKDLMEIQWDYTTVLYFLGYHLCCYCYYTCLPVIMKSSSSTVASVSSVTTNVYSLLFAIFLFNNEFSVFYIGGFIIIMFGLVLYNIIPTPEGDANHNYGQSLFFGTSTKDTKNDGNGLLDEWLNDIDDCYISTQQTTKWRMSIADADPDLDSLLDDLHKVKEETDAAIAAHDTRRPTQQLTGKEFDNFMQELKQSDIIHVPTSPTVYDSPKLCKRKSLTSEEEYHESIHTHGRPSFFQYSGQLNLPRPSSVTSPRTPSHEKLHQQLRLFAQQLQVNETLTPAEKETRIEAEKIMSSIKEVKIRKMIVKVINDHNGSSKMVVINEQMDAYDVCMMLAEKSHQIFEPNLTLIERLEDFELAIERTFEDHENVMEELSHWPKVHHNTLHFRYNPDKYLIVTKPQMLIPDSHSLSVAKGTGYFTEEQKKKILLNEIFVDGFIPQTDGKLFYKDDQCTSWKKHHFWIRTTGLYVSKSGKAWLPKEMVAVWSEVCVYSGTVDFRKYYKAPSKFCFSLVPKGPIEKVYESIKHFCIPNGTQHQLNLWITGIRIAKHGKQLVIDYETAKKRCQQTQRGTDDLGRHIKEEIDALMQRINKDTDNPQQQAPQDKHSNKQLSLTAENELKALEDKLVALRSDIAEEASKVTLCSKSHSSVNLNNPLASRSLYTIFSLNSQESIVDDIGSDEQSSNTDIETESKLN